ncbi:MAG: flavodoxin family protein [Tractidigestivibacter sp.]|uniref:flavodoxin family protein n=1 Tax=Tractidigestivibacter sp. TaxID=2847320 RepID=UPI003D914774
MKVLMLNSGMTTTGNTAIALNEVGKTLAEEGIDYEIFHLPTSPIRDCISCHKCSRDGRCVFDDDPVNEFAAKAKEADGFVFGTPVYYGHPTGRIQSFLDRVFYSQGGNFAFKPGASVVIARRGGISSSFDVMNKYFGISSMITVGSTYWNMVYGQKHGEAEQDTEGLQTMRNLGRNMAWILKCIEAGRDAGIKDPVVEHSNWMNFIR